jgi:hypothetical protein
MMFRRWQQFQARRAANRTKRKELEQRRRKLIKAVAELRTGVQTLEALGYLEETSSMLVNCRTRDVPSLKFLGEVQLEAERRESRARRASLQLV